MADVVTGILERWTHKATCLALMLALLSAPVAAAVVTLANGDVIEGTIQSRVLIKRFTTDGDVAFRVVEGEDILSIDATGIHCKGESVVLAGMKGATPEDILQGLIWWREGRSLRLGQALLRDVGTAQVVGARVQNSAVKPASEELLGEYRIKDNAKKIELLSYIRLKKPDGTVVTTPIADLVVFNK